MLILGINDSSHDASISLVENDKILFAAHSERYNKKKNTFDIDAELLSDALGHGFPDVIAYFENRTKKRLRRFLTGGINGSYKNLYRKTLKELSYVPEVQVDHHESHAAAGYLTSNFDQACVAVIDAIGEFETTTIWQAKDDKLFKLYSQKYPVSFGLFYSAFTKLLGMEPGRDEYILMGMASFGDASRHVETVRSLFPRFDKQTANFHYGVPDKLFNIETFEDKTDIAAAVQLVFTERLLEIHNFARSISQSKNLVYMGGCALNCTANSRLFDVWDNIWIMPNPGDAGSSLGAALNATGSRASNFSPYLGKEIKGAYPVSKIIEELQSTGVVGVANGKAEFGPRALGNRSILADPRPKNSKQLVNRIKHREQFRPFAPVVLEEYASQWFELDRPSPYMQFTFKCKKPDLIPSVVHVDGTSRVQTVNAVQHPGLYKTLKKWHELTGVPVLLNTSLNVKNKPLVNDEADCKEWEDENKEFIIVTSE